LDRRQLLPHYGGGLPPSRDGACPVCQRLIGTRRRGKPSFCGEAGLRLRLRRASDLLQLAPPVQFFHETSRIAPARLDLDEKFEKDFGAYHLLDVEAGRGSNLLEHLATFAEQDGFLSVTFAINHRSNSRQPRTLFKLLDQNRDRVRHFF